MATDNTKLQYIIELLTQGDTTKAANELAKLDKASAKSATGMADIGKQFKAAFALIAGSALINESINAFLEQERAIAKVNAALKSTQQFTPQLSKEMQDLATALSEVSTFADEAILNVIAKLTAMGVKTTDVKRVTTAILDLSTLMDRDLNRATLAMTQALNGNVEALRTIGLQLDDTKSKTDQFNDALGQIEKKAGGQAAEAVGTLGGKFELMKKQVGELKEAFGGLILNAIDPYIEKLTKLVTVASNFLAANQKLLNSIQFAVDLASGAALVKATMGGLGGGGPKAIPTADLGPEATATLQKFFAAGGSAPGITPSGPSISTAGLSAADDVQRAAQLQRIQENLAKSAGERSKNEAETNKELERQANEIMQQIVAGDQMRISLSDQLRLATLDGLARERAQLQINHEARVRQIQATSFVSQQAYEQAIQLEQQLTEAENKRFEKEHSAAGMFIQDLKDIEKAGVQAFSSGLATAIVDAFEEGDKAFQKFAANFLRQIAEMILQALILRTLRSVGLGLAGGGQVSALASGGLRYAAGGLQEVSSPTFFPKFNVVAGEAGREMLTVLSRPRLETINGVPAQVGMAGRHRLAITSADALARGGGGGGAGGRMIIQVNVAEGSEARIVENSIEGAVVRMNQEAQENTTFSRTVRRLAS